MPHESSVKELVGTLEEIDIFRCVNNQDILSDRTGAECPGHLVSLLRQAKWENPT